MASTPEFTNEQYTKIRELSKLCKDYPSFVFENEVFKGLHVYVIKDYIKENPSKKFRIWMIDKGYRLNI